MKLLDLMEPEETIGNLWHDMAHGMGGAAVYADAAVTLAQVRPSLAVLFRALGGDAGVEMAEAAATLTRHRRSLQRKLGAEREKEYVASFDGLRLRLPPFIAAYADHTLNRAAYFWLVALAAFAQVPRDFSNPRAADSAQIAANAAAAELAHAACPGIRAAYREMSTLTLAARGTLTPAPSAPVPQPPTRPRKGWRASATT